MKGINLKAIISKLEALGVEGGHPDFDCPEYEYACDQFIYTGNIYGHTMQVRTKSNNELIAEYNQMLNSVTTYNEIGEQQLVNLYRLFLSDN